MKVAKVLVSAMLVLFVFSIVLLAGCKSKAEVSAPQPSSEEQELNQGLNELDELNQIDQEMSDVSLDELDEVDLQ